MYDKHYEWSPYVYVLNNPLLNCDIYGYTDWNAVKKGSITLVGGLASTIGGIAAASTPTGVGQVGGAVLISTGIPSIGLGIGTIVKGFKDDGTAGEMPQGVNEALGIAGDKLLGNDNGELRKVGEVVDVAASLAGGGPKTPVEAFILGAQVIGVAEDFATNGNNTGSKTSTTIGNSDTPKSQGSDSPSSSIPYYPIPENKKNENVQIPLRNDTNK